MSTIVVALVSALLLWLGWLLVGGVAQGVPALPPGTDVRVDGVVVPAERLGDAMGAAARDEVLRAGLIAFPLVVCAAALVSWVLVGRVLGQLHTVTAMVRRLSAESLSERIGLVDARGEVAELAAGFDAMLDRLERAFEAQRRFVANASHELRTPLAVLRTEVEVTLADPAVDAAELRRMAGVIREATRRADELIAGLLLLARTEGVGLVASRPVDLAELLAPAVAAVRDEAELLGVSVQVRAVPAPVLGDSVLLERVVGNLVENAVRHNVAGGWVEVGTGWEVGGGRGPLGGRAGEGMGAGAGPHGAGPGHAGPAVGGPDLGGPDLGGRVVVGRPPDVGRSGSDRTDPGDRPAGFPGPGAPVAGAARPGTTGVGAGALWGGGPEHPTSGAAHLVVRSSGPVIAPERVAELFEPFRRGPVDRTGKTAGAGLGLSIVRAVVAAHGGTVGAEPVPGGGLAVTVRLPS